MIIKLGALGDVIRTAAILEGVHERWPGCEVTWVTRANGVRMLANHPLIARLLPLDAETLCHIEHERFDACLSLDKEQGPAGLATRLDARERLGIGLNADGAVYPLNPQCDQYFRLGLDDPFKFHTNDKSYQRLIYEMLGLRYAGQRYRLYPDERRRAAASTMWRDWGVGESDIVVGLNTGAGSVFANKNWRPQCYVELARQLSEERGPRIALFGGPTEAERNEQIARQCPTAIDTGTGHDELTFAALLSRCNTLVTGDTMAMHAAIAFDVPCIVLFGPTCPQEIDLYGRGEQIVTKLSCAPCYRRTCDVSPNCMEDISVERVRTAVERWVNAERLPRTRRRGLPVVRVGT